MTDTEILAKVKAALGVTGAYQDVTLQFYIDEVKAFMRDAGVPAAIITSAVAVGCIARGVADLWNYGSGNAKLSEYFKQRMLQLKAAGDAAIVVGVYTFALDDTWTKVIPSLEVYEKYLPNSEITVNDNQKFNVKFSFANGMVREVPCVLKATSAGFSSLIDPSTSSSPSVEVTNGVSVGFEMSFNYPHGNERAIKLGIAGIGTAAASFIAGLVVELTVTEARA